MRLENLRSNPDVFPKDLLQRGPIALIMDSAE